MALNRRTLFDAVRTPIFGGAITQSQVEGVGKILDHREANYAAMRDDAFAYVLATVTWETGHKMIPVREGGGEAYLRSKRYYPWVGEGLVQVTWEANARKFGATKPGDCMSWPVALRACFEGMSNGVFTGKKLADYFGPGKCDFKGARHIINGTDRDAAIAAIASTWLDALKKAGATLSEPIHAGPVATAPASPADLPTPPVPTVPRPQPPASPPTASPATAPAKPVTPSLWARIGASLATAFFKSRS